MNLSTGEPLTSRFTNFGCKHGGGIQLEPSGRLWVADTNKLFLFPNGNILETPQVLQLKAGLSGVDFRRRRRDGFLWVGDWNSRRLYRFAIQTLLNRLSNPDQRDLQPANSIGSLPTPDNPNGAEFMGGVNFWIASSTAKCSVLRTASGQRLGMAPGMEEFEFAPDGTLWAVFEAGSLRYTDRPFFPLLAQFDPSKLTDGQDECDAD